MSDYLRTRELLRRECELLAELEKVTSELEALRISGGAGYDQAMSDDIDRRIRALELRQAARGYHVEGRP